MYVFDYCHAKELWEKKLYFQKEIYEEITSVLAGEKKRL